MSDREFDPFIDKIAAELRRPVRFDARFDERVMAAIEAPAVIPLRPAEPRPWLRRRWTVSVSPVTALVAAALVGVIGVSIWRGQTPVPQLAMNTDASIEVTPVANTPGGAEGMIVTKQFLLVAPDARSVIVVGDFNNWDTAATRLTRLNDNGVWSVTVPLRPGQYRYQFIVNDSTRVPDPRAPQVSDEFGGINSLLTIGPVTP